MIRFRFQGVQGLGSWGQDPEAYGFLDCSYLCRTWQAAPWRFMGSVEGLGVRSSPTEFRDYSYPAAPFL